MTQESPFLNYKICFKRKKIKIYDNCRKQQCQTLKISKNHAIIIVTDHTSMINDLKKLN